jgi:hypothetical protein
MFTSPPTYSIATLSSRSPSQRVFYPLHDPTPLLMPERDYAAPLRRSRRSLVWTYITGDHRSSVDWKSATPLTPALRDKFPDLSGGQSSKNDVPPVPPIPGTFQADGRTLEANDNQRHSRTGTVQTGDLYDRRGGSPEFNPQPDLRREPSNFSIPRRHLPSQRENRRPELQQVVATTHQYHDYSSGPSPFPVHLAAQGVTSSSSTLQFASSPHDIRNVRYLRDSQGRLSPAPSLPHRTPHREPPIRRQSATLSSLREQVLQGNSNHVRYGSTTDSITSTNAIAGHIRCSRFPSYSTTESYTLSHSQQSSTEARLASYGCLQAHLSPRSFEGRGQDTHHPTIAELQASTSGRTDNSLDPNELREVDDLLTPLPMPTIPYAHHPSTDRTESTTSIATSAVTLGNRSSASRPLTFMEANFVGFANVVGFKQDQRRSKRRWRSWKANFVNHGKKIKSKVSAVWDAHAEDRKSLRCMIDVLWSGELSDCQCLICMTYVGSPWCGGRRYHEVPKGGWRKMSPPEYHKLNWGVEAVSDPTTPRGLGAFRGGPDCPEVKYVTTRVDLDE